ncbi:MAG TPA: FtsX-like permease family protein [Ktedonobacterales bacterium]|nr:FtsX-like permease family protein [Ktedonobacterales bacterium]
MDSFFDFSSSALARPLLITAVAATVILTLLAVRRPHLARIGLRNARRRRARTLLIVAGLMLSTTFIAAALAVDDTISLAVKTIAVFNLGRVDEDVLGGAGSLHLFPASVGGDVTQALAGDTRVAGVAPALVVLNILVADETARQVHGGITTFALAGDAAGPLADLRTTSNTPAPVSALRSGDLYLNSSTAKTLDAHIGDTVYLYSTLWPGHRYQFRVRAIVAGGPLGDPPAIVISLSQLQAMTHAGGSINHIFVANTGDGLTGVSYSDQIEDQIYTVLTGHFYVDKVKQDGINFALRAQDIFGRILALFTLFSLAIGLLLIFLIFVLLAAERRAELGMLRALGVRRSHIVRMLLFEGGVYDVLAAFGGILTGLGLGIAVVLLVSPTVARIGFPLKISIQPQSIIVAFCLGLLATLVTIGLAAWSVSRMTVAAALRDLPEPPPMRRSLLALLRNALGAGLAVWRVPAHAIITWATVLSALITRGPVPLILGWVLLRRGIDSSDELLFSFGLSLLALGVALSLRSLALSALIAVLRLRHHHDSVGIVGRSTTLLDRLTTLLVGAALALYWSLPFDALRNSGFSRFGVGGIQTFFVAGVMMVFGTVWALAPNLDLLLLPISWLLTRIGRLRHIVRMSLVYPAHHRFRTGISLSLFALVCFTMVVMACIAASATQSYDTIPQQASGYDIAGQPLFQPVGGVSRIDAALARTGAASNIAAVSSATPLPLGLLQPGASNARWSVYPVSAIQGAFLNGVGLPLIARASGFTSDAAVWQAVRTHPGDVVVDAGALSDQDAASLGIQLPPPVDPPHFIGPPIAAGLPGLSSLDALNGRGAQTADPTGLLAQFSVVSQNPELFNELLLHLDPIVTHSGTIAPARIWAADLRGGAAAKLTIVGIVQNLTGQRTGLFGSLATFAPVESGLPPFGNEYYYFKVKPGGDARTTSLQIGSSLIDFGFETTVLQDVLLDINGPRVLISRVLVGLVGLTLLVGMAALAVTGSRAVVERRQQIGMLRALGFHSLHVQLGFLIESLLVGAVGTAIGLVLGLILCRNVFAVDFFEPVQSGLTLVIPWKELIAICIASLLASTIAALLPAWQAGRVAPADALRYE